MMDTLTNIPKHLRLYTAALALAALVIAVAAVTLTAVPAQAQDAGGIGPGHLPRTGDNEEEYARPYPCSEEAEPDASTKKVIDGGHYALFDAFWDYEVGHMSNNFCPPEVTHTSKSGRGGTTITHTRITRERPEDDTHTHISETVFSVPDRYKVTVIDSGATNGNPTPTPEPNIDLHKYPFLKAVVSVGDSVWWVKAENVPANTDANTPMILGFSTDLLEEEDWYLRGWPRRGH